MKTNQEYFLNVGFFWIFCIGFIVFCRGCGNTPSTFEHYLNAKYQYKAPDANWEPPYVKAMGGEDAR